MTGLWTYPWSFFDTGLESSLDTLAAAEIDHLKVAAHYHSVQTFDPKASDLGFRTFPGGCLFEPNESDFERTSIEPLRNDVMGRADAFGELVTAATERGFDVDAWVVCLHGTRLASRYPQYQIEDVFGDNHGHSLCPSHPAVREYFASVIRNVSRYDITRIDLESIGFPSVVHDHGSAFGHHKDHVITDRASEFLVSQCFCDGCEQAARGSVDVERARDVVVDLCKVYLTQPDSDVPSLTELIEEYPVLGDLFEFRETVIGDLLAALHRASGDVDLSYYLADGGAYRPAELWPSGVTPDLLEEYVDSVTALCYTDDPQTITRRVAACQKTLEHDVDVGLTLDPAVVDGEEHWNQLATLVAEQADGDIFVYNYDLMTAGHLEWLAPHNTRHVV